MRYRRPAAASKAYALAVNGREESAAIDRDGIAHPTVRAGSTLFEVAVTDPPYRLPIQRGYVFNRWIACSKEDRRLTMEIGEAGEAPIVAPGE